MSSVTAYSFTHSFENNDEADDTSDVDTLDNTQYRIGIPPSDEILESLKADIGVKGVEKPVIADENGVVIDGHHRVEICRELGITNVPTDVRSGLTELEKWAMARRLNCQRRQLDEAQKRDLIEKALLQYDSEGIHQTDAQIATECGSSETWVREVRHDMIQAGEIRMDSVFTTQEAKREATQSYIQQNPDESNRAVGRALDVDKNTVASVRESMENIRVDIDGMEVIHDDFRDVDFEPESVDLIVTNPPWADNGDDLELWSHLGEKATRCLRPGGFLVAYAGKMSLDDHVARLREHVEWHTQLVVDIAPGKPVPGRGVRDGQRPVLVFQRPPTVERDDFFGPDLIDGTGREKDGHEYQQSVGEIERIVTWLTEPGDTVLDPFAGSGTTLLACLNNDREAIGIEEDEEHVDTIHERLENET